MKEEEEPKTENLAPIRRYVAPTEGQRPNRAFGSIVAWFSNLVGGDARCRERGRDEK